MVVYHYDANAILFTPLKNRQANTIVNGFTKINDRLKIAGLKPSTWILDNEFSQELRAVLQKEDIQHQLVPPHCHRANAAERAIQTAKNHLENQ